MKFKRVVRAFTLIELLVVIVVVGMLSSLSVATYNNYTARAKVAVIEKTVNDLSRFTVLYAREQDKYYSELSLAEIVDRFGIKKPEFTQIVYVASETDFFYEATLPNGQTEIFAMMPKAYAVPPPPGLNGVGNKKTATQKGTPTKLSPSLIHKSLPPIHKKLPPIKLKKEEIKYYVQGTPKAMAYFQNLTEVEKENFMRAAYDSTIRTSLFINNKNSDFKYKKIASPWNYDLPDQDRDGIPDYRDKCPDISGIEAILGCPLVDTDGDGVTDDKDNCPEVAGDKYAWGCVVNDNITIKLTSYGAKKINVIKAVRSVTGLGLKEAKRIIDTVPSVIKSGINAKEAEEIKNKIEEAGGTVDYK